MIADLLLLLAPLVDTVPVPAPMCGEICAVIHDVWPDDLEDRAVNIVFGTTRCRWGESGGDPEARSQTGDYGLFQINRRSWRRRLAREGFRWSDVTTNPTTNAQAALWIWEHTRNGWRNWSCAPRTWGTGHTE